MKKITPTSIARLLPAFELALCAALLPAARVAFSSTATKPAPMGQCGLRTARLLAIRSAPAMQSAVALSAVLATQTEQTATLAKQPASRTRFAAHRRAQAQETGSGHSTAFRGALVGSRTFGKPQARGLREGGYNSVVFDLAGETGGLQSACAAARAAGLKVYGWLQVGRDLAAARLHPKWLHTPQHGEWLATTDHSVDRAVDTTVFAPVAPSMGAGSETRRFAVFPWVCVNNRDVFAYEANRVQRAIAGAPRLDGLFLCDIQGAPMGCGCGNPLCRSWDSSYGPKVAEPPYQHPDVYFSRQFVAAVERANPGMPVLPVLCEECENGVDIGPAENPDLERACHGVPCAHPCSLDYFPGLLRAFAGPQPIGLISFYRLFRRNRPEYGPEAAWITGIVRRVHQNAPAQPVICVLQGWSGSRAQRAIQVQRAMEGGATGYLMAMTYVNQSWEAVEIAQ